MFVNIHSHKPSTDATTLELLNIDTSIEFDALANTNYYSAGIHPWKINILSYGEDIELIKKLATQKNIIAIGECGMDKLININLKIQKFVFISQITIAEQIQKPLIIHCVKAFDELIRMKKEMTISVPMIVHGFNNNEHIAKKLLQNGFYFSFGKALLMEHSNASKIISTIPIEKLFLETDDADVSIKSIFDAASKHLQIDIEALKQQIYLNFKNIFIHE